MVNAKKNHITSANLVKIFKEKGKPFAQKVLSNFSLVQTYKALQKCLYPFTDIVSGMICLRDKKLWKTVKWN